MSFALVLHGHIPYCRKSGTWPAGEEWLHEAILEVYLPVHRVLDSLASRGLPVNVNIEFNPVLLEQLADGYMQDRFVAYVEDLIARADRDIDRFRDQPRLQQVATRYHDDFTSLLVHYRDTLHRDVIGGYRRLQEEGHVELFTSAATHGFLPLLKQDSSIRAQLRTGVDTFKKHFGRAPAGCWLPECAFRPMVQEGGTTRPGIDHWLRDAGLRYIIVNHSGIDAAKLTRASPGGVSYTSTYESYKLAGTGIHVFGRNYATSEKVWSAATGYPGNPVYREFHVKDQVSGLRYAAVSRARAPKDDYDPVLGRQQARLDAADFASLVRTCLQDYKRINARDGIVVSPYDFELFGHWWHEGPTFIEGVIEAIAGMPADVRCVRLSDHVSARGDAASEIVLGKTSWGEGGDFRVWDNVQHGWIWPLVNSSAREFEEVLAGLGPARDSDRGRRILAQAARELLLLQGSDWPFLLYTEQAREYANQRFHWHHQRFHALLWAAKDPADHARLDEHRLREFEDIDNPFHDIDVGLFERVQ